MPCSTGSPTILAAPFAAQPSQEAPSPIIGTEAEWRAAPSTMLTALSSPRALPTRWRAFIPEPCTFEAETPGDRHVVKFVLRTMNIRLSVDGRIVHDGVAMPGMFHVSEPNSRVRCLFRGPYDVLHLHVPDELISDCARDMPDHPRPVLCSDGGPSRDSIVEWLARALLGADDMDCSLGQNYADCLSLAIVTRLLTTARRSSTTIGAGASELTQWRLKRAIEYVEARLSEPVRLAEVAATTGLTRMHFAAQFKAATGLRPHEYLLRRRIERAQEMLLKTGMPLVDVALSVGFQTQAHFTGVFKRFAGSPPRAWLRSHASTPKHPADRELIDAPSTPRAA